MRQRINHLLKQVELEQEAKRQIEVALLQEQIHPHFLYNTLYSIIQLCELKKTEKASEMLTALATFYRIGLNRGENIITVEEELRHVKIISLSSISGIRISLIIPLTVTRKF